MLLIVKYLEINSKRNNLEMRQKNNFGSGLKQTQITISELILIIM